MKSIQRRSPALRNLLFWVLYFLLLAAAVLGSVLIAVPNAEDVGQSHTGPSEQTVTEVTLPDDRPEAFPDWDGEVWVSIKETNEAVSLDFRSIQR